jgi:hypothetical protein
MVDSANKESSADFYKVLNDDVLIDNIETNILKNIADNEARPEGSPEIKFSVLMLQQTWLVTTRTLLK